MSMWGAVTPVPIHYEMPMVPTVAPPAAIETRNSIQEKVEEYREKNFSYIPVPSTGEYFVTESEEFRDLQPEQFLHYDASIRGAIESLTDQPFLLFSNRVRFYLLDDERIVGSTTPMPDEWERIGDFDDAIDEFPDREREVLDICRREARFRILTISDINKRQVKEQIYPVISELEWRFADEIRESGKSPEDLFDDLSPVTIGRWKKSQREDIEIGIADHLKLSEMLKIVGKDEDIRDRFGFSSRNQFDQATGGLVDLRNKIMHSTRTLVHDREDLDKLVERISRAESIIEEHGGSVNIKYSDSRRLGRNPL